MRLNFEQPAKKVQSPPENCAFADALFSHFSLIFSLFTGLTRETSLFSTDPSGGHSPSPSPGVFLLIYPVAHHYFRFFFHIFFTYFCLFTGLTRETSLFLPDPCWGHATSFSSGVFKWCLHLFQYYFTFVDHFCLLLQDYTVSHHACISLHVVK